MHQRAGYRAAEYVTHTVLAHRKLSSLTSTDVILSLDSFKKNYAGHCEGLDAMPCTNGEDSTQAFMDKQAVHFVETALEAYGNRMHRWLEDLVDCVIADPNPIVAFEVTRVLVAVYDGEDKNAAVQLIDGATVVEVEGQTVNLLELVADITQFVTTEILHESSVLFVHSETAGDIKERVTNGGNFIGESGQRLERTIKTLVYGRPVHSHLSERMVNIGNRVTQKHGKHETEVHTAGKVNGLANGTLVDARLAAYEYEALERAEAMDLAGRTPTKHWRDAATGFSRTALGADRRPRGKGVILLKIKAFLERSARITVSVGKAALELASDRKAGGTGLAARAEARAAAQVVDAKANVAKRMASKTMTQYDAAYFATAAAASNPPRLEDLLNPPSKEILAQECELRDLPVKRSGDDTAHPRQATELVQFLV